MNYIVKRDGRKVQFNRVKVERAIEKAFDAVDGQSVDSYTQSKIKSICDFIEERCIQAELSVEEIQDLVENGLMNTKRKDVARAYITYRNERTKERERNSALIRSVEQKLLARNVLNQNANVDEYSFGGRMGEANDVMTKQYALNYIMSPMAVFNHLNNKIYTHDLSHFAVGDHNCLTVPFDDVLSKGFNTRQTDVRAAKSINTFFQLLAVVFQLQSLNQFGKKLCRI